MVFVKKIYSNKSVIYFSIFGIVFISIIMILSIISLMSNVEETTNNILMIIALILIYLFFLVLFVFSLNKFGYKVIYDSNKKVISKKGFIFGHEYQIKLEDIKEVAVLSLPKETAYYVLTDSKDDKQESFIKIKKTKKNEIFVKQFWDKSIKEYEDYEELFNK